MKIEQVVVPEAHPQLLDFIDQVTDLLNNGKYQFWITDTVPTHTTEEGSCLIYSSGTTRKLYFYINGVWCDLSWTTGGTLTTAAIYDSDYDTGISVELAPDEDIIRMFAGNVAIVTADIDQFAVNSGIKLGLEGNAGDTYWKYNSATEYEEGYVNDVKRIEL